MKFRAYPKIHRYGKEETEGILDTPVTIQEKIDGANVSIWLEDGIVRCGSRTRTLPLDESFNGFQEYVNANPYIKSWLEGHPTWRLYGEWLVKHTISYPDEAYRKMYLFDVYSDTAESNIPQSQVKLIAYQLCLEYPQIFAENVITNEGEIKEKYVGKSFIAANGEGVVIKNHNFTNKFGDHVYAKIVHEKFKESNAIVFGGNNKHSECYNEMYIVNKYCTLGRVTKIMQKIQSQTEEKLDMKHTSQVVGSCYHDMVTEDIWEITKKIRVVNFTTLQRLAYKKFIQLYHDILNNSISIADKE